LAEGTRNKVDDRFFDGEYPKKNLKGEAVRGGVVRVCAEAVKLVFRTGSLMVLARLLDPRDFGLVGMVIAVTGFLEIFKDAGLSMVTIQRPSITDEQISTLFWLNMLFGITLFAMSLAIAPLLVAFYRESRLFWVTAALASGFIFSGAAAQHGALLQRQMRFAALAAIDISSLSAGIAVGVAMAVSGCGYWSLVGMYVTLPAVAGILLWLVGAWIPGFPRRKVGARSMLRFGGTLSLNGVIVYLLNNVDKVLLGRFYGAEILGLYGRAYQLISIPTANLNSAIGSVAFAALSRIQDDADRFKNYFLKGYSLVLALILPVTVACPLFADDIILVILGPKWNDVVPLFRLLAPTVLALALVSPFSWLILAKGEVGKILKMSLLAAGVVISGYVIGLRYGAAGVASGYSAGMTLLIVPLIAWAKHGTPIGWADILHAVSRPLLSAGVAAGIAIGARLVCGGTVSPFFRLLVEIGFLSCSYLLTLLFIMKQKTIYVETFRALRRRPSVA
jgi:O-antigen/teichoic acid export membrane protein